MSSPLFAAGVHGQAPHCSLSQPEGCESEQALSIELGVTIRCHASMGRRTRTYATPDLSTFQKTRFNATGLVVAMSSRFAWGGISAAHCSAGDLPFEANRAGQCSVLSVSVKATFRPWVLDDFGPAFAVPSRPEDSAGWLLAGGPSIMPISKLLVKPMTRASTSFHGM